VISHFQIEENTKAGFELKKDATQFIVIEAKMRSRLSHRTVKIDYWDQVSRNVACMAEAIAKKNLSAKQLKHAAFYVTAPEVQIDKHKFKKLLSKDTITGKVKRRAAEYGSESTRASGNWYQKYFLPLMEQIEIAAVSWESIIELIIDLDPVNGEQISSFYDHCLKFN